MKWLRFSLLTAASVAAGVFSSANARADLIITVNDATMAAGGTGFLDVLISSTLPGGEPLNSFLLEFSLTDSLSNPVNAASAVQFAITQSNSQFGDGSYVFAGNSDAVGAITVTPDSYVGGDFTSGLGATDQTVSQSPLTNLLVRLDLSALLATPANVGETFLLNFVPGSSFFTSTGDPNLAVNVGLSDFQGQVTLTQAVPEPSSFLLAGLALSAVGLRSRRRKRGPGTAC